MENNRNIPGEVDYVALNQELSSSIAKIDQMARDFLALNSIREDVRDGGVLSKGAESGVVGELDARMKGIMEELVTMRAEFKRRAGETDAPFVAAEYAGVLAKYAKYEINRLHMALEII